MEYHRILWRDEKNFGNIKWNESLYKNKKFTFFKTLVLNNSENSKKVDMKTGNKFRVALNVWKISNFFNRFEVSSIKALKYNKKK